MHEDDFWVITSGSDGELSRADFRGVTGESEVDVTRCLGVHPGPGFGFGVRVPESGMGWDGASASGLLCQLVFRVQYLVIGGGHVVGCNGEAVDSEEGDRHEWRAKRRGQ